MSNSSEIILKVENIESYYGPIMALKGVSLQVPKNSIVSVLGADGAGKTTLMKNISGVMDPEKGKIFLEDEEIDGSSADILVRKGVSHVPEGREVFPMLSVEQNLFMGAYTRKNKAEIKSDIELFCSYFPVLSHGLSSRLLLCLVESSKCLL